MRTYTHPTFKPTPATEVYAPGTPEWQRTISASKISALLGLSNYDSAYTLWAKATGRLGDDFDPGNSATYRGNLAEPSLLEHLRLQVPGVRVAPGRTFVHPEHPQYAAAPDGLVYEGHRRTPFALVEAKTAAYGDDWGEEGTAIIPPGYLVQCAWQMWVTGARLVYVPALVNMDYRLYVVHWDEVAGDMPLILELVAEYEACLAEDRTPAWDGSTATYKAVRRIHSEIDRDAEATVPASFAAELWDAHGQAKAWESTLNRLKSEAVATADRARLLVTPEGDKVARRQGVKGGGTSLVVTPPKVAAAAAA